MTNKDIEKIEKMFDKRGRVDYNTIRVIVRGVS